MPSLKCMIDKLVYKGKITLKEHSEITKKLEGHDRKLIEDFANAFVDKVNNRIDITYSYSDDYYYLGLEHGYLYSIEIVDELLREK